VRLGEIVEQKKTSEHIEKGMKESSLRGLGALCSGQLQGLNTGSRRKESPALSRGGINGGSRKKETGSQTQRGGEGLRERRHKQKKKKKKKKRVGGSVKGKAEGRKLFRGGEEV